ncbi:unnamed protein product, partial [Chrysoparadoxa australica]
ILRDGNYVPSGGDISPGGTYLDPKQDRYQTSAGVIGYEEYNRRARENTPPTCTEEFRFMDETWVKYNHDSEAVERLYKLQQNGSRNLQDKGAGLRRDDVEKLRNP